MIVSRIYEGLGNQLFQYAMGRATALRHHTEFKLDTRWFTGNQGGASRLSPRRQFRLDAFRIRADIASARELAYYAPRHSGAGRWIDKCLRCGSRKTARCVRETNRSFDPNVITFPDAYLSGYWQTDRYFTDFSEEIRQDLQLCDSDLANRVRVQAECLRADGSELVGVHVRRGDLDPQKLSGHRQYGPPTSTDYLRRAMDLFDVSCRFVIVCEAEERAWCQENLTGSKVHHHAGDSDLADFAMLQNCDHNIIANSTFSWWAAWLNPNPRKRVIAPLRWYWPGRAAQQINNDRVPTDWLSLDSAET